MVKNIYKYILKTEKNVVWVDFIQHGKDLGIQVKPKKKKQTIKKKGA